jgi:hypothetical protein
MTKARLVRRSVLILALLGARAALAQHPASFTNPPVTTAGGGVTGLTTCDGGTALADNDVLRADGTTGCQGSVVDITDAGIVTGATQLNTDNVRLDGDTVSNTAGDLTLDTTGAASRINFNVNAVTRMDLTDLGGSTFALRILSGPVWAHAGAGRLESNFVSWNNDAAVGRVAAGVVGFGSNGAAPAATWQTGDPGVRPTCDADVRGRYWHDQGAADVADVISICCKKADNTYAWATALGTCS